MKTDLLKQVQTPQATFRDYRISQFIGLSLIAFVSFRKLINAAGHPEFLVTSALLGAFTLLSLTQPTLARRHRRYLSLYYLAQMALLTALGLLHPYEDTWGLLYIILGVQLRDLPSRRAEGPWAAVFTTALLVTMTATKGLLQGLGFSLLIIAVTVFFYSGDLLHSQAEAAKGESQRLLMDLQAAHRKLEEYAAQAEEQAAAQEHDRLIRELHDSVSQMIFSISLTAASTRLLLTKDPSRLPGELERLQELTGRALAQMRALISQWRPG